MSAKSLTKSAASIFLLLALFASLTVRSFAQGCVAAHSNQRTLNELVSDDDEHTPGGLSIHNLTLNLGYRVFNSNKYFIGTDEINRPTVVRNHQNIFDIGIEYRLTPRWSLIADVPVFDGTRNQIYPPSGIFQVSGIGDMTVGAQSWIFRPPTENNGNIAVSLSLKIPTGINNATGSALLNGKIIKATADQSLQPGDGGWGFMPAVQAYKSFWHRSFGYLQGQYLVNPEDTNGIPTFRTQPGQGVMSVTDQYLWRAGISQGVPLPKIHGLAFSAGIRDEGVPAHDLLGSNNGFRRPGYIVSFDPGLLFNYKRDTISVNGPWALARNREPSVPELENGTKNGDAFFADYTVIVGISHHF
jgi:hypothetical protein